MGLSSAVLLLALAAAPDGSSDASWKKPEPDTLERVFGVRYIRPYGTFEVLDSSPEEWSAPYLSRDGVRVFVGARSGVLECLDVATGESLWKRNDMGVVGAAMVEHRGHLIVGSDQDLLALDQQGGVERWRVPLGGKIGGGVTLTGTVALLPIRPNSVVAVDIVAGQMLWRMRRATPDGITVRGQAQPTVDLARGAAYLGFSDGVLMAVDLAKGETIWLAQLGNSREFFADVDARPLLLRGGNMLLAASYNGGLFAIDPENGRTLWKKEDLTKLMGLTETRPGFVVAAHGDGFVLGLYAKQGTVRWRYKSGRGFTTEPIYLGHDLIMVGLSQGPITLLALDTGRPVQVLNTGTGLSVPPAWRDPDLAVFTNGGTLLMMRYGAGTFVDH